MFLQEELSTEERFEVVRSILAKELLSNLDFTELQKSLDGMPERDAAWHYMQAAVHYYRHWYLECKRILKKAVKLAPDNELYKKTYEELIAKKGEFKKYTSAERREGWMNGWGDVCCEGCGECCCVCGLEGACQLCEGC